MPRHFNGAVGFQFTAHVRWGFEKYNVTYLNFPVTLAT